MVVLPNQVFSRSPAVVKSQTIMPNRPSRAGQKVSPVTMVAISTPKKIPRMLTVSYTHLTLPTNREV